MGFIKAFTGTLDGVFADQWPDFLTVPRGISPTAALFPTVHEGRNARRGSNTKDSENTIGNGLKIMVPDGYDLVSFQDGRVTGFMAEPGGFGFYGQNPLSQSVFVGGGVFGWVTRDTWECIKFSGQPGTMQQTFFVNLKELPDSRFGTQSEIYQDDAYPSAQVRVITRGTYTLRIVDPLLFISNVTPGTVVVNDQVFGFDGIDNPANEQLFTEVVACLGAAFSKYTNDPKWENRIIRLRRNSIEFTKPLSAAVEENYQWRSRHGLLIERTTLTATEYDASTREPFSDMKKADALRGDRGASFMQQPVAQGVQSVGESGGNQGLVDMGIGVSMMDGVVGDFQQLAQQPTRTQPVPPEQPAQAVPQKDLATKLRRMKELPDAGVVSQKKFDTLEKRLLGL